MSNGYDFSSYLEAMKMQNPNQGRLKYGCVFWDIDGTLCDNSGKIPDDEVNILPRNEELKSIPDRKLHFWVPYEGLPQLMEKIPKDRQGIISNGYHQMQLNKLVLLGLYDYINPGLIFTSYGVAERILDEPNHPLPDRFKRYYSESVSLTDIGNLGSKIQKPDAYMFEFALKACGCDPEDCVMIGDDWKDVAGAQKAGMKTIYISGVEKGEQYFDLVDDGKVVPDYIVQKRDIATLEALLLESVS